MMIKHIVKQGETLSTIALKYKIDAWEDIYNHEANARFKELRVNPECIYPGDVLYIPDSEPISFTKTTNKCHSISITVPKRKLVLHLKESIKTNMASTDYEIHVNDKIISGNTADGKIEEEIPVSAKKVLLKIWPDSSSSDFVIERELSIGDLDPEDEISGLQARLQNLGYYDASVDGDYGNVSSDAIVDFQIDHDLEPTGKFDSATKSRLGEYFES